MMVSMAFRGNARAMEESLWEGISTAADVIESAGDQTRFCLVFSGLTIAKSHRYGVPIRTVLQAKARRTQDSALKNF
jgi:hypothetical protein